MNCVVFVTVRTASTRLPKKALLKIRNKPLIKILIDRIKSSKNVGKIVVCTTDQKSDDKLVEFLEDSNIEVFRGDSVDILNRLFQAARKYKVNQFVVVEGDDLFCEPVLIDETCRILSNTDNEYVKWMRLPDGVGPVGIKTNRLDVLVRNKVTKNTDTGWKLLISKSKVFKEDHHIADNKKWMRPEIRLTIDYMKDFRLAKKIYENLPSRFSLTDIINLLNKNPKWLKINESVKEEYRKNLVKKTPKMVMRKKDN